MNSVDREYCDSEWNLCFLKGIHAYPKSRWIEEVDNSRQQIHDASNMCARRRILEDIAGRIRGIGPTTVDKTLAYIEDQIANEARR